MNAAATSHPRVLVIHGPNLNLLGSREPHIYGRRTLEEINASLASLGLRLGVSVDAFQSNHEGALVDRIQQAAGAYAGIEAFPGKHVETAAPTGSDGPTGASNGGRRIAEPGTNLHRLTRESRLYT